jgi:hypothetical protein
MRKYPAASRVWARLVLVAGRRAAISQPFEPGAEREIAQDLPDGPDGFRRPSVGALLDRRSLSR